MKVVDLTGQRFGKLIVIRRAGSNKFGKARWECVCDCGKTHFAVTQTLREGGVTSCGCEHIASAKRTGHKNRVHGQSPHGLYVTWRDMLSRCQNPKHKSYHNYGGRGVNICSEWATSFERFAEWAISAGWKEGLTIDRIEVNGNYTPDNCKWSTRKEQAQNRRTCRWYKQEVSA